MGSEAMLGALKLWTVDGQRANVVESQCNGVGSHVKLSVQI